MTTIIKNNQGLYQVKPGDSLYKIATATGRTVNDLLDFNPALKANPNLIKPGQQISLGQTPATNMTYKPQAPTITQTPQGTQVGNSFYQNFGNYSSAYPSNPQTNTQTNTQTNNGGYDYSSLIAGSNTGSNTNYQPTNSSQTQSSGFAEALRDMLLRAQKINREGQDKLSEQSNIIKGQGLSDAERIFKDPGFNPTDGTSLGMSAQDTLKPLNLSIEGQQASGERSLSDFLELVKYTGDEYRSSTGGGDTPNSYQEWTLAGSPGTYQDWVGKGTEGEKSPYFRELASNGISAVDGLIEIANSNPGIFGRSAIAPIPEMLRSDDFRNYKAQLDYLKGNIIPAALTAMREASKTGGALGQVSDREGAWLASSLGALDMSQSSESIKIQLDKIRKSFERWQQAVDANNATQPSQTNTSTNNTSGNIFQEKW